MDLQLYGRVLWRFRVLVGIGLLLAVTLSSLTLVRIGPGGVSYRHGEVWQGEATLFVTQEGFPWGRAVQGYLTTPQGQPPVPSSDPTRLSQLAILYSQFATSDPVLRLLRQGGPVQGTVAATPVLPPYGSNAPSLPLISLTATGPTREAAASLARRATRAFTTYLALNQREAQIPPSDRVVVQVIKAARDATLFAGRKKTLPILVFLATMIAFVCLAFILENLRPRVRVLPGGRAGMTDTSSEQQESSRTAQRRQ